MRHVSLFAVICIALFMICNGDIVPPTHINESSEYYITSVSNKSSFSHSTIICGSTTNCIIQCDVTRGCYNMTINASLTTNLLFTCSALKSCIYSEIIDGPSYSAFINCHEHKSCANSNFNIKYTQNVDIECVRKCSSCNLCHQGSCDGAIFDAEYAINVNIQCGNTTTNNNTNSIKLCECYNTVFNVNNTNITIINSDTQYNNHIDIYGKYIISQLTINCMQNYSCTDWHIYCPHNATKCNIECGTGYSGCQHTDIYCGENTECNINCDNGTDSCTQTDIHLTNKKYEHLNLLCTQPFNCNYLTFTCSDTRYSSDYIWAPINGIYGCTTDGCCLPEYDRFNTTQYMYIQCNVSSDCNINCNDYGGCPFKTYINASYANSLTIDCNETYQCQYINVYPPKNGQLTVHCTNPYSCEYMRFDPTEITSLSLYCLSLYSCRYLSMKFNITQYHNISCLGVNGCDHIMLSLTINNSIYIDCTGNKSSCYAATFIINGVNDVFIDCSNILSCYHSKFYIQPNTAALRNVNILCSGEKQSCDQAEFNIHGVDGLTNISFIAGHYGLQGSDINIFDGNQLSMTCADHESCEETRTVVSNFNLMNIYCNVNKYRSCYDSNWEIQANYITLQCHGNSSYGDGCRGVDITANISNSLLITTTTENAFNDAQINVICSECLNTWNCLQNITLFCGLNYNYYMEYPVNVTNSECQNCMCSDSATSPITHSSFSYSDNMWQHCIPTTSPTLDPTRFFTNQPSLSANTLLPTGIILNYGVVITVTFKYVFTMNDTVKIMDIVNQTVNKLISENGTMSDNNCVLTEEYNISSSYTYNTTIIIMKIFVCNEPSQNRLLATVETPGLDTEIIKKINDEINLRIDDNVISIQGDIMYDNNIINNKTTTTDLSSSTYIEPETKQSDDFWVIISIILSILVCCIVVICIWIICKIKESNDHDKYKVNEQYIVSQSAVQLSPTSDENNNIVPGASNIENIENIENIDDGIISKGTTKGNIDDEKRREEDMAMVAEWLKISVQLLKYYDNLINNGYESLVIIKEISNITELNEIGITSIQHQTIIMAEIKKLKNKYENDKVM